MSLPCFNRRSDWHPVYDLVLIHVSSNRNHQGLITVRPTLCGELMRQAQKYQENILHHLAAVNNIPLTEDFSAFQLWQSNRLLNTHKSLYQQPRFKPAMLFFKDELYGSSHFKRRNQKLMRAIPLMCNTMPESILAIVEQAAELHNLTVSLDTLMIKKIAKVSSVNQLTMATWVKAYRDCRNQSERQRQLNLIESLGKALAKTVQKPRVHVLLNWARVPAMLAGYEDIHRFVCSGFNAFEKLENPNDFLDPIIRIERELSDTWFLATDETLSFP